jgi:RimJ/RimL family protein N-acetyltransferase
METMIETTRLRIVPLTMEQFSLLLYNTELMEQKLKLAPSYEHLDKHTQQAMELQYRMAMNYPEYHLWFTNWQIILKSENLSVGSANFKNNPDTEGIVEIGYGINPVHQNQGFMTEALHGMCQWAFQQNNIKQITAETHKENYASQKVIKKCGFNLYQETPNTFWWKLEKYQHITY